MSIWIRAVILPAMLAAAGGWRCTGDHSAQRRDAAGGDGARARGHPAEAPAARVRTAARPADACGWVPASEVERFVGPLAGPPRAEGDSCRYPLPVDSLMARRLAQSREAARRLVGPNAPALRAFNERGRDEAAVIVQVDLSGGIVGELAESAMAEHFAGMLGEASPADASPGHNDSSKPPAGWDQVGAPLERSGFIGRLGHISVVVSEENADIPREQMAALAARVRDRIADLPFAYPEPEDSLEERVPGPDPCGLLTRSEAEAVLGKLLVAPYHSRGEGPYVDEQGESCAYFTSGHHALVITPRWSGGKTAFSMIRGVAGAVGTVLAKPGREAESADTLEGPWDQATVNAGGGQLVFLVGDRLLEVDYLRSSTDAAGAVRLARLAVERFGTTGLRR